MEYLLSHLDFTQILVLILLTLLFFKEELRSWIKSKWTHTSQIESNEVVPSWAQKLIQYANHDTTDRLEKLIAMEEKEHEKNDDMHDILRDISHTLEEMQKYGIPCRTKEHD